MSSTKEKGKRQFWDWVIILGGTAAALFAAVVPVLIPGETAVVCEAKETGTAAAVERGQAAAAGEKREAEEVIEFVTAYRKAFSPEGIDTLADYVDDPESRDFQTDLMRNRVMFKLGVKGWENIKVVALPMSDGKHWVASVSSDLVTENFDFGIPGLNVVLVGRNEEDELKIVLDNAPEESDVFVKEVREICLTDEMQEHSNEIATAYNTMLAENPAVIEWAESTNMAIEEELGKMLEETSPVKTADKSETSGGGKDNVDTEKDRYIVQKGDCLWKIAKEQLGDGMLWGGLYERNRETVGENPDLLYVGIELQLN